MKKCILLLLFFTVALSSCDLFLGDDEKKIRLYKSEIIENTMAPTSVGFYFMYFYSDKNELISIGEYNSKDVLFARSDYEYTSDGKILSSTRYKDDGITEQYRNEYQYNLNGDVSIIMKYYRNDFSEKCEYIYNDGIIMRENIYEEADSEIPDEVIIPTYDEQNLLIKIEYYSVNSDGTIRDIERYKEYNYDEKLLIRIDDIDTNYSDLNESMSFSYNSDDKITTIKKIDDDTIDETTVEYDSNGIAKGYSQTIDTIIGDEKQFYKIAGKFFYEKGESQYSAISTDKYLEF